MEVCRSLEKASNVHFHMLAGRRVNLDWWFATADLNLFFVEGTVE